MRVLFVNDVQRQPVSLCWSASRHDDRQIQILRIRGLQHLALCDDMWVDQMVRPITPLTEYFGGIVITVCM